MAGAHASGALNLANCYTSASDYQMAAQYRLKGYGIERELRLRIDQATNGRPSG